MLTVTMHAGMPTDVTRTPSMRRQAYPVAATPAKNVPESPLEPCLILIRPESRSVLEHNH